MIEVHFHQNLASLATEVYLIDKRPDGKIFLARCERVEWVEAKESERAEPTVILGERSFSELKEAFVKALGLKATEKEKHLAEAELGVRKEQVADLKNLNERLLTLVEDWGGPHGRQKHQPRSRR